VASKSAQQEPQSAEAIEAALDHIDTTLDRLKVLYEQFFLGIQKQAPTFMHTDVERKLRELAQVQIRNTALRYRFATSQQKYGSYNTYWRRTLRQIENGTYVRQLSKLSRDAARTGEAIPEEILAAMPKRMREQVRRDREQALSIANRRKADPAAAQPATAADAQPVRAPHRAHELDGLDDFDVDAFFASVTADDAMEDEATHQGPPPAPPPQAVAPPPPPRPISPVVPPTRGIIPTPPSGVPVVRPPAPAVPGIPAIPAIPQRPGRQAVAPSQTTRSVPIVPGAARAVPEAVPEVLEGPFERTEPNAVEPTPPSPARAASPRPAPPVSAHSVPRTSARPAPARRPSAPDLRPPPGMTDADVNALYAKYVQAKQMVGEQAGPGAYGRLLKTISAQAPKIMEQYGSKGVDFSVVVKDNQVVIRAKPKP
jgi:hypothetical protein